jgi:hypothetical protein
MSASNTLTLLLPMLPTLPSEIFQMNPPLELAFSIDDGPRGMVHNDVRERAEAYAKAGKGGLRSLKSLIVTLKTRSLAGFTPHKG